MKHQSFLIVRFKNRVLIPTQARMDNGAYLAIDPVAVHEIADEPAITRSIADAIIRGNPNVPTPPRSDWPNSVLIRAAGVRSQAALEKSGVNWAVGCDGTQWHIYASHRNAKGRWEVDVNNVETRPADIAPEQLARRMLELVKSAKVED